MPATHNFSVYRGDTWLGFSFTLTRTDGDFDLTGATALMQVKAEKTDDDAVLEIVPVITPETMLVTVGNTDIEIDAGRYYYDLQITLDGGDIITPIAGKFVVEQDVTR